MEWEDQDGKFILTVNEGKNLPGKITIRFEDNSLSNGKYIYLYHNNKEKYELLNTKLKEGEFTIDVAGTYQITEDKLHSIGWSFIILGIMALCIIAGGVTYIIVSKKYWFW